MKRMLFVFVALLALVMAGCSAEPAATPTVEADKAAAEIAEAIVSVSDDATAALAEAAGISVEDAQATVAAASEAVMAAAQASSEDVIATVAAASGISAKDAEATVVAASEAMMAAVSMTAGEAPFSKENPVTIKVGASPVPHAAMLEAIKDDLAEMGVVVEIVEFTDYVLPNMSLEDGSIDANFFQHQPYLDDFNASESKKDSSWTTLVPLVAVHFEPMGLYKGKTASIDDLADGATIAVPNDPTNEARALLLLEANGLIKIAEGKGLEATAKDTVDNPKKIKIQEIEAAQVALSLQDVDLAVINGNYALEAGLTTDDAIAQEAKDSEAAVKYANVVAVRDGEQALPQFIALAQALTSDAMKTFLEETYKGSVAPAF
mgnify:FL=1